MNVLDIEIPVNEPVNVRDSIRSIVDNLTDIPFYLYTKDKLNFTFLESSGFQ